MAPDINSLPTSHSPGNSASQSPHAPASPRQHSPTLHHRSSPRLNLQRRASSRLGSFSLNDSASSSPVTADPHHQRQPSLGELHQELEEEQEAQVNRLLSLIRQQQAQIVAYESSLPPSHHLPGDASSVAPIPSPGAAPHPTAQQPSTAAIPHSPSSSRPSSTAPVSATPHASSSSAAPANPRASTSLSRNSSRRSHTSSYASSPSHSAFPAERGRRGPLAGEHTAHADRDEMALIQAEAQLVARENQMLKGRIRELERQVAEARRDRAPLGGSSGG